MSEEPLAMTELQLLRAIRFSLQTAESATNECVRVSSQVAASVLIAGLWFGFLILTISPDESEQIVRSAFAASSALLILAQLPQSRGAFATPGRSDFDRAFSSELIGPHDRFVSLSRRFQYVCAGSIAMAGAALSATSLTDLQQVLASIMTMAVILTASLGLMCRLKAHERAWGTPAASRSHSRAR